MRPSMQPFSSKICWARSRLSMQRSTEKPGNSHSIMRANQTSAPMSKNLIGRKHSCASRSSKPAAENCLHAISRYCSGNGRSVFPKSNSTSSRSFSAPTCSVMKSQPGFKMRRSSCTLKSPWRFITMSNAESSNGSASFPSPARKSMPSGRSVCLHSCTFGG